VNLGIGIPTLVANYIPAGREVILHSENGVLGLAPLGATDPPPADLINAGKEPVSLLPGGCYFDHSDSFCMIRGGHIDVAVLGAFQVSCAGDLANWSVPGDIPAVGGAMDLAVGALRVYAVMTHQDRSGSPKLVAHCSLPLTARNVVDRIYTDLGVFRPAGGGFEIIDLALGVSPADVAARTDAPVSFCDGLRPGNWNVQGRER
jgi:3-oxoadipate CoA-transferase, beta subunit